MLLCCVVLCCAVLCCVVLCYPIGTKFGTNFHFWLSGHFNQLCLSHGTRLVITERSSVNLWDVMRNVHPPKMSSSVVAIRG